MPYNQPALYYGLNSGLPAFRLAITKLYVSYMLAICSHTEVMLEPLLKVD